MLDDEERSCGPDGDGDGIDDHLQASVASLPSASARQSCLTLKVSNGCDVLRGVSVSTQAAFGADPLGYEFPFGIIGFTLPCASADVSALYHGARAIDGVYRKYGPIEPGNPATAGYYTLPADFDSTVIDDVTVARVTFHLVDGQLGDATGADGQIVDPGGVAMRVGSVPVTAASGLMVVAFGLLFLGFRGLRASHPD